MEKPSEDNRSSSGMVRTSSSMQEQDDDPQSSPLSTSYNLNLETPGQSEKEEEISDLLDSTVEKTPTNPSDVTPIAVRAEASPFKTPHTPHRPVDGPVEKKMRMKKGTLFHETPSEAEAQSSSRGSQTNWPVPEKIQELLRSVSQNQEESPAPALNYRTPSDLLLDRDMTQAEGLMKNVQYCIAGKINENVKTILKHAEAKPTIYPASTNTHIIMGSEPDMSTVESAKALNENVLSVDQDWVMLSCLVGKLLPISEDKLLAGVVACVGEMSGDDKNKIWAMLTWRGAKMVTCLSPEVTHVIVNDTQDQLYTDGSNMPNIKFVTSDWVQRSLQTNSRIDENDYHPQLLQEEPEASEEVQEDMDIDNNGKL